MNKKKISIITPVFNEPDEVIDRCLQSVSNISENIFHIIVVDGSNKEIKPSSRRHIINLPINISDYGDTPRAVGAAVAAGMSSDFIIFLDADNFLVKDFDQKLLILSNEKFEIGIVERSLIDENKKLLKNYDTNFWDTSQFIFTKKSYDLAMQWINYPREFSVIDDRIISKLVNDSNLKIKFFKFPLIHYLYKPNKINSSNFIEKINSGKKQLEYYDNKVKISLSKLEISTNVNETKNSEIIQFAIKLFRDKGDFPKLINLYNNNKINKKDLYVFLFKNNIFVDNIFLEFPIKKVYQELVNQLFPTTKNFKYPSISNVKEEISNLITGQWNENKEFYKKIVDSLPLNSKEIDSKNNVIKFIGDELSIKNLKNIEQIEYLSLEELLSSKNFKKILIESNWWGKNQEYKYIFPDEFSTRPESIKVFNLLKDLKKQNVELIYWDKEGVQFNDTFKRLIKISDYAITNDERNLLFLKEKLGKKNVSLVGFSYDPKVFNPLNRKNDDFQIGFAGSFYNERFPERKKQLLTLLYLIKIYGGDIYDRFSNFNDKKYLFPENFLPLIKPSVPYEQIPNLYKNYLYHINASSLTNTSNFVPRRVYEICGSASICITQNSLGIEKQFSNVAVIVNDLKDGVIKINELNENYIKRRKTQIYGWQRVNRHFTNEKRLSSIDFLNLQILSSELNFSVCISTNRQTEIDNIVSNINRQTWNKFNLYLYLENYEKHFKEQLISKLRKDIKVYVFDCPNQISLGERYNDCILRSENDVFVKMDDDDIYGDSYLEEMAFSLNEYDHKLIGKKTIWVVDWKEGEIFLRLNGFEFKETDFIAGPTICTPIKYAKEILFPNKSLSEDSEFIRKYIIKYGKLYSLHSFNFAYVRNKHQQNAYSAALNQWKQNGKFNQKISNNNILSFININDKYKQ